MIIPYQQLHPDTLNTLIEEFVTRDGAVHGHAESPMPAKVAAVLQKLKSGAAAIVYDEADESCTIMPTDGLSPDERDGRRIVQE